MPIPPDLQIFFPNGGTSASQMYIWDGSKPVAWDGSISVSTTGGPIKDGVTATTLATVFDFLGGGGGSNPLAVAIVDTTGAQISSFGGGTQYVDGTVHATPTGTVALWLDSGNVVRAPSATKPLPVDIKNTTVAVTGPLTDAELRATPVPISGTVATGGLTDTELRAAPVPVSGPLTDTELRAAAVPVSAASLPLPTGAATEAKQDTEIAGLVAIAADTASIAAEDFATQTTLALIKAKTDNLDVALSTKALESGGNLAAAATSLAIMDDWDETDRAKVNPIAGQAGVQGNSGNVTALTQRVVIATDQPALSVASNYVEKAIYGTAQTCIDLATDIAAANFSGAPAATFDNTSDSAVPYARQAKAVAVFPDWAAAPVALTTVDLYGVLKDVDGTADDTDAPSGTSQGGARFFGSFVIAAADALQRRTITISLDGVEKVDFYFRNGTAQNMNNDGGTNATLKVTPFAYAMRGPL